MLSERAFSQSASATQEIGQLGVGAMLGNEPLDVVAPAPPARLAHNGERRRSRMSDRVSERSRASPSGMSGQEKPALDRDPNRHDEIGRVAHLLSEQWGLSSKTPSESQVAQSTSEAWRLPDRADSRQRQAVDQSPGRTVETPAGCTGNRGPSCAGNWDKNLGKRWFFGRDLRPPSAIINVLFRFGWRMIVARGLSSRPRTSGGLRDVLRKCRRSAPA
jgi:hypothetical protein